MKTAARVGWVVLILATLFVCYFSHLGAIGFVGPDEPRYAWIARDMAETGDWVTPRLYGKPWFEKPVLYYWGAAASFKVFGVSEAAARLPSAVSALLATLALAWLAWRLYGAETARWLLLLLPTTVGMIGFSHAASTDMPFSGMLTIAMVCAAVVIGLTRNENSPVIPQTPWLAHGLFGVFLGLAVLAKGPAAIILSGGAVFFWALFTKRWRDAFRCFHPVALATFCLTALPWYILCARRNPDFFRVFIIEHNFKRFLTPEFQHIQPFWYYIPILIMTFFPWSALLFSAATDSIATCKQPGHDRSVVLFSACWAVFTIAFFSASKSKLPGYILPSVPALGMLMASAIPFHFRKKNNISRWVTVALGGSLLALGLAVAKLGARLPLMTDLRPAPVIGQILTLATLGGLSVIILALFRKIRGATIVMLAVAFLLVVSTNQALVGLDGGISAREAAKYAQVKWPVLSVGAATTYKLQRSFVYQLNFYLRDELKEWSPETPANGLVFAPYSKMQELSSRGFNCLQPLFYPAVIVCEDKRSVAGLPGGGQMK
jgi:4-amino-4-deoxy-L-arabinose transferase-like glycosyltransferase